MCLFALFRLRGNIKCHFLQNQFDLLHDKIDLISMFAYFINLPDLVTLFRTMSNFNNADKRTLLKHYGKSRKCWQTALKMFSILLDTNFLIWIIFNLSSAHAFNLGKSKMLLSGKELALYPTTKMLDLSEFNAFED